MSLVKIFKNGSHRNLENEINSFARTEGKKIISVEFIFDGEDYVALVVFE